MRSTSNEGCRCLKRNGWIFVSHSYGHINFTNSTYQEIVGDTERWKREIEPLIGKSDLFIYPFSARMTKGSEAFWYMTE
ncbi:polysaccharide deacetylase family protein [Macrococcoides caseolyticum]|uniref:polysaccharide deacetylase family protein n=1 Tax=Macrococcoides caseolyticum TaxID=69966 RepID=UPI0039C9D7A2